MVVEKGRRIGHFEELAEFSKDRRRMVEFVKGSYKRLATFHRQCRFGDAGIRPPDDASVLSITQNWTSNVRMYCYYPEEKRAMVLDRSLVFGPPDHTQVIPNCASVSLRIQGASSVESEWSQGISAQKYHGQKC